MSGLTEGDMRMLATVTPDLLEILAACGVSSAQQFVVQLRILHEGVTDEAIEDAVWRAVWQRDMRLRSVSRELVIAGVPKAGKGGQLRKALETYRNEGVEWISHRLVCEAIAAEEAERPAKEIEARERARRESFPQTYGVAYWQEQEQSSEKHIDAMHWRLPGSFENGRRR